MARSTNPRQPSVSKKEFIVTTPRTHRDNIMIIFINTGSECINGHLPIHVREKENNTKMQFLYACNRRDTSLHSHGLSSLFKNRCKVKKTLVVFDKIWFLWFLWLLLPMCSSCSRVSINLSRILSSPSFIPLSDLPPPLSSFSTSSLKQIEVVPDPYEKPSPSLFVNSQVIVLFIFVIRFEIINRKSNNSFIFFIASTAIPVSPRPPPYSPFIIPYTVPPH